MGSGGQGSVQPQKWLREEVGHPLGGLVSSGLCQELDQIDVFVSTLPPNSVKKPV